MIVFVAPLKADGGVGGFEWRTTREDAELATQENPEDWDGVFEYEVPDHVMVFGEQQITDWLDAELWARGRI